MLCPYCGSDIKDRAFQMHKSMCTKRPNTPSSTAQPVAVIKPSPIASVQPVHTTPVVVPVIPAVPVVATPEAAIDLTYTQAVASGGPLIKPDYPNGTEVWYPKPDPFFIVDKNMANQLNAVEALSKKHPTNLLITGHPGGGKTTVAIQFAAVFKRPIVIADFGIIQEPQQLFQTTRLIKDGDTMVTHTRESGFVIGIETPNCVVVMDEMTRAENDKVLNPLMPLLDGRGESWIDELRRRVTVAPGVVFIATINEGSLFAGVGQLDGALRDRFNEVSMSYLAAEQESDMLVKKTGVPKLIANSLAEFASVVRRTPNISRKISTRQLLHAAESYTVGLALWQAVDAAIGNFSDTAWRQQCLEIFSLNIKDPAEFEKWEHKTDNDGQYVAFV